MHVLVYVFVYIITQSNGALELLNFDAVNMGQTHFINNDFFYHYLKRGKLYTTLFSTAGVCL